MRIVGTHVPDMTSYLIDPRLPSKKHHIKGYPGYVAEESKCITAKMQKMGF